MKLLEVDVALGVCAIRSSVNMFKDGSFTCCKNISSFQESHRAADVSGCSCSPQLNSQRSHSLTAFAHNMIFEEWVDALTTTADYRWAPIGKTYTAPPSWQQNTNIAIVGPSSSRPLSSATYRKRRQTDGSGVVAGTGRPHQRRRCGVHHGIDELRKTLLSYPMPAAAEPRRREAAASNDCGATNETLLSRLGDLSSLHDTLLLDVLAFASARDLARVESCCRFARRPNPTLAGRSTCEHVAWSQLQQKEVDSPQELRGSMQRLHLATSRVFLNVLRRRSRSREEQHDMAAISAAATIARNLTAPVATAQGTAENNVLRTLQESDVASNAIRVRDGVFADASLFDGGGLEDDVEIVDVPFEQAKAIGLSMRTTDAALAGGDCVVDSVPEALLSSNSSSIKPDGCWLLRSVNGNPCWSPEAYHRTLDEAADDDDDEREEVASSCCTLRPSSPPQSITATAMKMVDDNEFDSTYNAHLEAGLDAKALVKERLTVEEAFSSNNSEKTKRTSRRRPPPSVRLEFEHAYDRKELALPLAVSASTAIDFARLAFEGEDLGHRNGTTAVLFAADERSSPGRAACWTDADRGTTLADFGLHAGHHATFLLYILPELHATTLSSRTQA